VFFDSQSLFRLNINKFFKKLILKTIQTKKILEAIVLDKEVKKIKARVKSLQNRLFHN